MRDDRRWAIRTVDSDPPAVPGLPDLVGTRHNQWISSRGTGVGEARECRDPNQEATRLKEAEPNETRRTTLRTRSAKNDL